MGGDLFFEWGAHVDVGLHRESVIIRWLLPENGAIWHVRGDSARGT